MNDKEIIQLLGGASEVARMLGIKPPSVYEWIKDGIPEGRLRELAAQIEIRSDGRFTRRDRWPNNFAFYWPELAQAPANIAQAATETVAPEPIQTTDTGALRAGSVRRHAERRAEAANRRAKEDAAERDRRAKGGPPFQGVSVGEA